MQDTFTLKLVFKNIAKKIKFPKNFEELKEASQELIQDSKLENYMFVFDKGDNQIFEIKDWEYDVFLTKYVVISKNKVVRIEIKERGYSVTGSANNDYRMIQNSKISKEEFSDKTMENVKQIVEKKLNQMKEIILTDITKSIKENLNVYYDNYEKSTISNNSTYKYFHNINCDCCGNSITGIRYKCATCPEYNRCDSCEFTDPSHENKLGENHIFIKIRNPEYLQTLSNIYISNHSNPNSITTNSSKNQTSNITFYPSIISNPEDLSAKCLNHANDLHFKYSGIETTRKTIKLVNNGKIPWPKNVSLTCLSEISEVKGKTTLIKVKVDVNKEINVEIIFDISKKASGKYSSHWQMVTENDIPFGEIISLNVEICANPNLNKSKKEIDSELKNILNGFNKNGKNEK